MTVGIGMPEHQQVVVTGLGLVSPLGDDPARVFARSCAGSSGIRPWPVDAAWPPSHGGWVADHDHPDGAVLPLARQAAKAAFQDAGLAPGAVARAAVFVGTSVYTAGYQEWSALVACQDGEAIDVQALSQTVAVRRLPGCAADASALAVARDLGCSYGANTHVDACAAGGLAMVEAVRQLRAGWIDVAVVGGVEAMARPIPAIGFHLVGAASRSRDAWACRPFSAARDGFVIGEAAAFLVLERAEHAQARRGRPRAVVSGVGRLIEGHRITATDGDGRLYADTMQRALADAGACADAVDLVSVHGTGTQANDDAEAQALRLVFGERWNQVPVTAIKAVFGHTLGASAPLALVLAVESIRTGLVPPVANHDGGSGATAGFSIATTVRSMPVSRVLVNAFGFGGADASILMEAA
jgi:3-oxoacyl-[acyl-carrier-protein] synthase II